MRFAAALDHEDPADDAAAVPGDRSPAAAVVYAKVPGAKVPGTPGPARDPAAGAAVLAFCGTELRLLPDGALWWPEAATLVVADLHFEKASSLARRGSLLPPYDTAVTLDRLDRLVAALRPACVISLGDAFHDPFALERIAGEARQRIAALQAGRDWVWVAGNHDRALRGAIGGTVVEELAIGPLLFRHEPAAEAEPGEIAGHLHPAARVLLRPKSVRRRCFATDGRRLILPAFGALTGGLNLLDRAYRGLFDPAGLVAHLVGDGRVYSFPRRHLAPD